MKPEIYVEEPLPIEKALPLITDNWIESGQYCDETLTTMRDALRQFVDLAQKAEELNLIVDGPHALRWSYSGSRLTDTPQWCIFYTALKKLI